MELEIIRIIIELIVFDLNIWVLAKGQHVSKLEGEHTCVLFRIIFSKIKKKTKIHYSVLAVNLVVTFLEIISALVVYVKKGNNFGYILSGILNQIKQGWVTLLVWGIVIGGVTILFMAMTYRAVDVEPVKDEKDGNRRLNADEIDKEYIDFSKLESIDGHSVLLLIAGDLSFLGDVPDIKSIKNEKKRSKCKEFILKSYTEEGCCKRKCPKKVNRCIEKSEQLSQLVELHKKGIKLHIICKKPNSSNDISYKRRLGFLKKIFANDFKVHFLPEDALENGICVLGRIKENGGIKELFWHWKDPEKHGIYIVPETKRVDSSENKTLIYLFEKVLWEYTNEMTEDLTSEYINEYEKVFGCEGE